MSLHPLHLCPTPLQLRWQKTGFGLFCHFGINTFFGREWSDGTLPASGFAPSNFDARQWVSVAQEAGMGYLVLTAKHHDGFCLWPTETTDYSVCSSPWRGGKGDVVAEVAEACRDAGLHFGLYLSPWDRHETCYPDAAAYDDFYVRQLTELCSRYGPIFELWFDGAGSEGRVYDWERIMGVAQTLQPDAQIFNMGKPTIRWAGNENGIIDDPVRYVTAASRASVFTDSNQEILDDHPAYRPPECDVPIRRHWFWQPDDVGTLKSTEHLLAIWYRSIGLGANLLLNLGPDQRGRLDDLDVERLLEMTTEIQRRFGEGWKAILEPLTSSNGVLALFPEEIVFDHLELVEPLETGQHITGFTVIDSASGRELACGGSIGMRRIEPFLEVRTRAVEIRLDGMGTIERVTAFRTNHTGRPLLGQGIDYTEWAVKADLPTGNPSNLIEASS